MNNSEKIVETVDVIIIGGGPAGLFTALNIKKDKNVLLLEKMESPGRKLLMSGSGQCNITHTGDIQEFSNHYGDNHRFLRTPLRTFSNQDLFGFL